MAAKVMEGKESTSCQNVAWLARKGKMERNIIEVLRKYTRAHTLYLSLTFSCSLSPHTCTRSNKNALKHIHVSLSLPNSQTHKRFFGAATHTHNSNISFTHSLVPSPSFRRKTAVSRSFSLSGNYHRLLGRAQQALLLFLALMAI